MNKNTHKPSSKKAEWEDKGTNGSKKSNASGSKQRRKGKARKEARNQQKPRNPDKTVKTQVDICEECHQSLRNNPVLTSSNERIVEDIPEPPAKIEIVNIIIEKK